MMKAINRHIEYPLSKALEERETSSGDNLKADFEKIFFEYEKLVRGIILRMGLENDVDELSQEIFVKIWKGLSGFDGRASIKTWIYRVAHNSINDHLRKKKRRIVFALFRPESKAPEKSTDDGRAEKEQKEWINEALKELKPDLRMVLSLAYMEDLSINEISEIVGSPEGTIKSRIFHAKKMMKEILVKKGFGDLNGK